MDSEIQAIIAVLLAALLHAGWNTVVKTSKSGFLTLALLHAWMAGLVAPLIPVVAFPSSESWNFLWLSVLIHVAYNIFLCLSYRAGDLSFIYPIARGSAPIVVAGLSPFFAGEVLSVSGYIGVLSISLGLLVLTFRRGAAFTAQRKSLLYALATGMLIGLYTLADGMGARLSGAASGYIVWLFFLEGLSFLSLALLLRRRDLYQYSKENWRKSLLAALMAGSAYGIVVWALTIGEMAYIAALRETSVLFAALIGAIFLREPFGSRRIVGSGVVAAGIILLNL